MSFVGTQISVSTTFFPAARFPNIGDSKADLIMYTSDGVFFYAHMSYLQQYSSNSFGGLLTSYIGVSQVSMAPAAALQTIAVQETSIVFNLLLHVLYGINCERFAPSLDVISHVLDSCFPRYGLRMIGAGDPSGIGAMILRHAASAPLRAYGLAASQGMEDVCVASSKFTFQITLDAVSENDALRMGPIYLRRLFLLHLGVVETLKKLLALLPSLHEPKGPCTPLGQQKLAVAWREAVASILLQEAPQRTTSTDLIDVLGPLRSQTTCSRCWESCRQRTMEIIRQWETLKRTI